MNKRQKLFACVAQMNELLTAKEGDDNFFEVYSMRPCIGVRYYSLTTHRGSVTISPPNGIDHVLAFCDGWLHAIPFKREDWP